RQAAARKGADSSAAAAARRASDRSQSHAAGTSPGAGLHSRRLTGQGVNIDGQNGRNRGNQGRDLSCPYFFAASEYNKAMGLKDGENLNLTCPCCQAKLVVDPVFGAVLSQQAHVKPGPDVDLTQAASILEEQKRQREDKFADSWFQETNKED